MRAYLKAEVLEGRELPAAAFQTLPVLPFSNPAVLDHVRAIFAVGQRLGRQLNFFVRFGDSNSSTYSEYSGPAYPFLNPLGVASYNPSSTDLAASHPELLDTWRVYHNTLNAAGQNSFSWIGPGAWGGWGTQNVLAALDSVIATSNPSVALIMIGTNELPSGDVRGFRTRLTEVVDALVGRGVVPVLSTVPDFQGVGGVFEPRVPIINQVIANVAGVERIPLWNFWRVSDKLFDQGIYQDVYRIHLTISPNGGGSFFPTDLLFAQNVRNLEALQILDWFRTSVAGGPTFIAPNPRWQVMADSGRFYAVGRDAGFSPTVDVFDANTGHRVNRFLAFGKSFGGGVRVATGDVNGDGYRDIICATGSGMTAKVNVFSGKDGHVLARITPFGGSYTGGSSVAVGDLNGDGTADIVVGQANGGSGVRVYEGGTFAKLASFQAFRGGGISVAVANVAGQGPLVAVGAGNISTVRLFEIDGSLISSFHPFMGSRFGITVTAADLNGDGFDELAVARYVGPTKVKVIDPTTQATLARFNVKPVADANWGIRLGTLHSPSGGDATLLVGNGPGSAVSVLAFDDLTGTATPLPLTNSNRAYGIFVG